MNWTAHPLPETLPASQLSGSAVERFSTGLPDLDSLLGGGLPRGRICRISGAYSSGKTGLVLSLLSRATAGLETAAYIDAFDTLDPESARRAGVDLRRLLWIRCPRLSGRDRIDRALKAADLLNRAGGFGVLVLDLEAAGAIPSPADRIPLQWWFRLQRTLNGSRTLFLAISPTAAGGSAASVSLLLEREQARWSSPRSSVRRATLQGIESRLSLLKGLRKNNFPEFAPGFGSDCADLREQNRRRSRCPESEVGRCTKGGDAPAWQGARSKHIGNMCATSNAARRDAAPPDCRRTSDSGHQAYAEDFGSEDRPKMARRRDAKMGSYSCASPRGNRHGCLTLHSRL